MTIEPDTKDWTWILAEACPECGFDAPDLDRDRIPQAIRDNATLWDVVLATDDAAVRPSGHVWSPLEYACHVRDVNALFEGRLQLLLGQSKLRCDGACQPLSRGRGLRICPRGIEWIRQQCRIAPQLLTVTAPDQADLPAR